MLPFDMQIEFLEQIIMEKNYTEILAQLQEKIRQARQRAGLAVNRELLAVYWEIGSTILEQQAAEGWGARVIDRLATDLKTEFPDMQGLSVRNIKYMRAFAEAYPHFPNVQPAAAQIEATEKGEKAIVQPLVAQIPWAHHLEILNRIKDPGLRLFYMAKTAENGWSKSVLKAQIESGLHRRQGQAITNFGTTLPKAQSDLARETLKNPYVFDFVGIGEEMKERELERALVAHIKKFLLELGKGFAYVGNQFNIPVENDDYFLDLLFYNYNLHCFVVFELKVTDFEPEYAGKLNFYINTVNQQIRGAEDRPTIGVLLCKTPNKTVVEYSLQGIQTPMGVSEYQFTKALPDELQSELPTIKELEQELEKEIEVKASPLQEKAARLRELIAKTGGAAIQREKNNDDVVTIFEGFLVELQEAIKDRLRDFTSEFTTVSLGRRINSTTHAYFTLADLEKQMEKENIFTLGLHLRMEGFRKAGINAFSVFKDLYVPLQPYKYGVGTDQHKPWLERLYHETWTKEEINSVAERWCEEVIDDIHDRLLALQPS